MKGTFKARLYFEGGRQGQCQIGLEQEEAAVLLVSAFPCDFERQGQGVGGAVILVVFVGIVRIAELGVPLRPGAVEFEVEAQIVLEAQKRGRICDAVVVFGEEDALERLDAVDICGGHFRIVEVNTAVVADIEGRAKVVISPEADEALAAGLARQSALVQRRVLGQVADGVEFFQQVAAAGIAAEVIRAFFTAVVEVEPYVLVAVPPLVHTDVGRAGAADFDAFFQDYVDDTARTGGIEF